MHDDIFRQVFSFGDRMVLCKRYKRSDKMPHFDSCRYHVIAATPILKLSLWLTAALGALSIAGGIVAIIWNSISPTQINIMGMSMTTGHVGVAFTGLGIIALIIGVRSVNKNMYRLAALPPDQLRLKNDAAVNDVLTKFHSDTTT